MKGTICITKGCINEGRYCRLPHEKLSESTESIPELLERSQKIFNEFIRLRDKDKTCICCKKKVNHAGHYFPLNYSGVRFDEVNVNGQNAQCNCFKNSKAIDPEVETGLIARYGMPAVRDLIERAHKSRVKKWNRSELLDIIENYSGKVKQIKKKK